MKATPQEQVGKFFLETKGISIEEAFKMEARFTSIDIGRFAIAYHEAHDNSKELIEALEGFLNLKDLISYPDKVSMEHYDEAVAVNLAIIKAEAAIKKAKGE